MTSNAVQETIKTPVFVALAKERFLLALQKAKPRILGFLIYKTMERQREINLNQFLEGEVHYLAHDLGLEMIEFSPWHFRFIKKEGTEPLEVDVFPSTKKYVVRNRRKGCKYKNLEKELKYIFNI